MSSSDSIVIDLLPEFTEEVQRRHGGEQGAVVDRQFVAFGHDSVEAMQKAEERGYRRDQVLLTDIPRLGATYA